MNQPEPFVIERTYNVPIEKVWQAISDRDQMKLWYFDLEDFKPEVGFAFRFEGTDGCQTFMHLCEVTEVIPGEKLAYTWRYEGYEGNSLVTFALFPEGEKTRLKLTHEGLETLQAGIAAFARENFVAGWTEIIGKLLKEYLEKAPAAQPVQ